MKTLTKADDLLDIRDMFSEIIVAGYPVVSWQLTPQGYREVFPVFIKQMISDDEIMLMTATKNNFKYDQKTIYFYASTHKFIFKTTYITYEDKFARIMFPEQVKIVDQEENNNLATDVGLKEFKKFIFGHGRGNVNDEFLKIAGQGRANIREANNMVAGGSTADDLSAGHMRLGTYNATEKINTKWKMSSMSARDSEIFNEELDFISLDKEDEIYAEQRTSVRARPKEGKIVTIQIGDQTRPEEIYPLFDLSQGGLSFLAFSEGEFNSGDEILVMAFDNKKLDHPMIAIVRSVREADELGVQFKIGCQFKAEEG